TYSVQSLPQNFNTISTTTSEFALPGGLFAVGDLALVNGTKGNIVNGAQVVNPSNGGHISNVHPFSQDGVTITVTGGPINVNVGGSVKAISPFDDNGKRVKVTPGLALALFQLSRDTAAQQTIGLNSSGQVVNAPRPPATGTSH